MNQSKNVINNRINKVNITLMERYRWVAQQSRSKHRDKIMTMCEKCINDPEMYTDKMSRWLGFIQGVLYAEGLIDLNMERDRSRRLFHDAYQQLGVDIPESITV